MSDQGVTERLLRRDRQIVLAAIATLFALAALYTVFGIGMRMSALEMTAMRGMSARAAAQSLNWSFGYASLVWLMWWVMMIAMMLPSVSPTVLLYAVLLRHGTVSAPVPAISASFLGGYLTIWGAVSAVAMLAQWRLEATGLISSTMMTFTGTVPGAVVLIATGVFQFTPLKQACLRQCRSPAKFLAEQRRPGVHGAFIMGLLHGAYCLGCCWFLMALLFVGGVMNLYWIVALAGLVAIEKLTPHGEIVSKLVGAALIVWGASVVMNVF